MDPKIMRKVGMKMSVMMGVSLSFALSLIGNLASGHFTAKGFLISFIASTIVSLIIGFFVPIRKLEKSASDKAGLEEGSVKAKCLGTLISDLIYTPVITLLMVFLAYQGAKRQGAPVTFGSMFVPSLIISLIAAYILIFFLQPIYLRIAMKKR